MGLKEKRDEKGTIILFDLLNIVPFVRKHKVSPVDGQPLSLKDLIRVHFHRNAEGFFVWMVVGGCGWLWVVVGGCGWLWVVVGGCGWLWVVVGGLLSWCFVC